MASRQFFSYGDRPLNHPYNEVCGRCARRCGEHFDRASFCSSEKTGSRFLSTGIYTAERDKEHWDLLGTPSNDPNHAFRNRKK